MTWLLDTLVWTGALIAAALLLRRPVARQFGAQAAYALWFLPIVRLGLPPIVLPSWLAIGSVQDSAPEMVLVELPAGSDHMATGAPWIDWTALALTVWIAGAVIYALSRIVSYRRLRRDLLEHALPVGLAGRVRLLETPATASPLAFGVFDKVIALPPGFMASADRRARDLALAHELAHHRAHDLAFNFFALPLFAIHWFNPLSVLGWRAMRRDQEAACDARVVQHCDRLERATYAALIASTVAGPRAALAASMACPVLGDKSIIHRLRTITMTTRSPFRRRLGAVLIGASVLAVPLTATISYAQDDTAEAPVPPAVPIAPLPPRAPAAPLTAVEPTAPLAPLPPQVDEGRPMRDALAPTASHQEQHVVIVPEADGRTVRIGHPGKTTRTFRIERRGPFDEKAFEKRMETLDERLSRMDVDVMPPAEIARITADAQRVARVAVASAPRTAMVVQNCDGSSDIDESVTSDGKRVIRICHRRIADSALGGLRSARAEVARAAGMSADVRAQVLENLDREIDRLSKSQ